MTSAAIIDIPRLLTGQEDAEAVSTIDQAASDLGFLYLAGLGAAAFRCAGN